MTQHRLDSLVLDDGLAVCRLEPGVALPPWATDCGFLSVTRTLDELSVFCAESAVPAGVRAEKGWCALRVAGKIDS
jgi:hypothetical protein